MTALEEDEIAQVIKAESCRCRSMETSDWKSLEDVLDDDLTYTHANGKTETKAEVLAALKTFTITSVKRNNLLVRIYGDVAVMSGGLAMSVEGYKGQPPTALVLAVLQIWRRRSKNWTLVAYQCTRDTSDAA